MAGSFLKGVAYEVGSTAGMPVRRPSESQMRRMRPVGGRLALSAGNRNPYLTPNGYRKPNQQDLINEIAVFSGLRAPNNIVRVEDAPEYVRHCCDVNPYFHILPRMGYRVQMPDSDIEVLYYVHRECDRLIVVGSSLS